MTVTAPLSRSFRDYLKAKIPTLAAWPAYAKANGLEGKAHMMTKSQWQDACAALGLDWDAEFAACNDTKPASAEPANNAGSDEMPEGETMPERVGYEGRDPAEIIAEALAPVSAHMTPHLAAMLPDLLRPIALAAVEGPRFLETAAPMAMEAASGAIAIPATVVIRRENLAKAFGVARNAGGAGYKFVFENTDMEICRSQAAPKVDPEYIWQPEMLAAMAICDKTQRACWLFGTMSTGKTVGAMQYAARLGRPMVRIAITRETSPAELIGQYLPTPDGGTEWRDGQLTRAFRTPHCVILIDEPTLLRSGSLAVFQTVLDTREIHLPTGEIVRAADNVFVACADNTAGDGDETGLYVDTAPINGATRDRFALRVKVDFLPESKESEMLARKTGLHNAAAALMVSFATLTRAQAATSTLTVGVTFRRLEAWALAVKLGMKSEIAFGLSILNGAVTTDREKLGQLGKTNIRHDLVDGWARGTIASEQEAAQAAPSMQGAKFPADQ